MKDNYDLVIIGAGFTGLAAAYEATKNGLSVCVLEQDSSPGGLAGTFQFSDGTEVEKFYHHWFKSDTHVRNLIEELGLLDQVIDEETTTGMYFNKRFWRLSTPADLLRFTALSLWERIRLGLLVLRVRSVKDWKSIENLSISEWLVPLVGQKVYSTVWEPLVSSKFSVFANDISAVWMWKKLVLRGSTRGSSGKETLSYFEGGFGRLAEEIASAIRSRNGVIHFNSGVTEVETEGSRVSGVLTQGAHSKVRGKRFLFTTALPITASMFSKSANAAWLARLRRVQYLGNICLILRLNRSLSDTYWLNVNDPGFPFVGVIEHTNFDSPENYGGSHIVYLSRYISTEDPVWFYSEKEYLDYALGHLKEMFPDFDDSWLLDSRVWRADYAQPVTEKGYSDYVPGIETPFDNATISTMAHIYPEDRGTNYAIRDGRTAGRDIADST